MVVLLDGNALRPTLVGEDAPGDDGVGRRTLNDSEGRRAAEAEYVRQESAGIREVLHDFRKKYRRWPTSAEELFDYGAEKLTERFGGIHKDDIHLEIGDGTSLTVECRVPKWCVENGKVTLEFTGTEPK